MWCKAITGAIAPCVERVGPDPVPQLLLSIPTSAFILLVVCFAYGYWRENQAIYAFAFFSLVAFSGWWDRSVITLYSVISAVFLCRPDRATAGHLRIALEEMVASHPAGLRYGADLSKLRLSVARNHALRRVGCRRDLSIVIFTTVPLTRYTIEGLRNVPHEMTEAADMSGATRWQKLWSVQLPLALPTMAVGFNQAIMFAFFMVIIASFIGTQDLGQELQRTLAGTDLGKNFVLGIYVSLMALTFDLAILSWASHKKRLLGLP